MASRGWRRAGRPLILGELDCIGGLNSSFVMGEVKNTHAVPVR